MDGPQNNDLTKQRIMAKEIKNTENGDGEKNDGTQRKYEKELTLQIELTGTEKVPIMELLKCVRGLCGGLIACRCIGTDKYEITMTNTVGKSRLLDGFKIGTTIVMAKELNNDELVVSFLTLPAYISDQEIIDKLHGWGVSAISPIKRRMWPGTNIADGTRYVKVKFNQTVQSLPYSARFNTATGPEYFRVLHDRQVKVCRMCLQPGHILRECPEFCCHKCGVQGHYARECHKAVKRCELCHNNMENCICNESEPESIAESELEREQTEGSTEDSAGEEEAEIAPAEVRTEWGVEKGPPAQPPRAEKITTNVETSGESLPEAQNDAAQPDNEKKVAGAEKLQARGTRSTPTAESAPLSPPHSEKEPTVSPSPSADSDSEMDLSVVSLARKRQNTAKS
ncbi:hypothetical protein JOB18_019515, partial [Solea senegalensis]